MLDLIKQYAMEKYAGDETAVAEFVEGFSKEAGSMSSFLGKQIGGAGKSENVGDSLLKGFTSQMGKSLGGMAMGLGATGLGTLYNSAKEMNLHGIFLQALERAVQSNRILKESPKEKVLHYANTIFKFAPNVATDSNLLSAILANAIHGDGIDPMTIKTLTELEGRYRDNTSFSPKTYV
jgi:hypothetical protein